MSERWIWGTGLETRTTDGTVLDAWFPAVHEGRPADDAAPDAALTAGADERRAVTIAPVTVVIDLDAPPASTADAYLRLHALSHLVVRPNELNLDGVFAHLPNVAWTTAGPVHRSQS